jgi:hypothetical protein
MVLQVLKLLTFCALFHNNDFKADPAVAQFKPFLTGKKNFVIRND